MANSIKKVTNVNGGDMNLGQIIIDNENSQSLSKASELILKEYTFRNNPSILPSWISVISSISVLINRSEKWGIFLAKYNPNIFEFLFGYGPNQLGEYYLGHETEFNRETMMKTALIHLVH